MTHSADGSEAALSPLAALTGPFYAHADLLRWLRIDDVTAATRTAEHTLLAAAASDGSLLYPTFQFLPDGTTIPHLADVLRLLAGGIDDPWTWAQWLCAPDEDLHGLTSAQWLAAGNDPEPVLLEAARDAARWAT